MALPWLIGGAIAAGIAYAASGDDEPDECMYCSKPTYRDDMCRRHYREEQEEEREALRRESKRDANREVESEVQSFKTTSQKQIKNKYGIGISYNSKKVNISSRDNSKMAHFENNISELQAENKAIETLIDDFKRAQNEI